MRIKVIIYSILASVTLLAFGIPKMHEIASYYYINVNENIAPQQMARLIVEKYVGEGKIVQLKGELTGTLGEKAGVYVSIYKLTQNGKELRGESCKILPTPPIIANEIISNAIAATHNKNFEKIRPDELKDLIYSVDIIHTPQKVVKFEELDPKKYGIIVSSGLLKKAVILPNIEGINTVEEQLAAAKQKAEIAPEAKVNVERFTSKRYSD